MERSQIDPETRSRRPRARLILASASPRRREILTGAGLDFEVMPSHIPEAVQPGESVDAFAERLAREKALAVARTLSADDRALVLGADTVVALGDRIMGKPEDAEHAVVLLTHLMGQRHRVITGIAVATHPGHAVHSRAVSSQVTMRAASEAEIRDYVATGEPLDKAGAYALQGEAGKRFVVGLEGSRSNVIGLPLEQTLELLEQAGEGALETDP
jgi:septum formation protein